MAERKNKRRVAIACQGGGAHAAFTAGALEPLLRFFKLQDKYELVALSGTSGGAICAFLTWYALSKKNKEGENVDRAIKSLHDFWTIDNSAYLKFGELNASLMKVLGRPTTTNVSKLQEAGTTFANSFMDVFTSNSVAMLNFWRALGAGFSGVDTTSEFNPYDWPTMAEYWRDRLKNSIEKYTENADQGTEGGVNGPNREDLRLFIGAVNALTGEFWVFENHKKEEEGKGFNEDKEDGIGVNAVLASAAIPFVFKATHTGEAVYWDASRQRTELDEGVYWDGLYSQNPPIRDLAEMNPDEIWIIQIDPEEKSEEPETIPEIEDRRNELSGNTSLNQELYFVRRTNELVEQLGKWEHNEAGIPRKVLDVCLQRRINELVERLGKQEDDYTEILSELQAVLDAPDEYECGETHVITKVRRIELTLDKGYQSKMDRSLANIKTLLKHGCEQAHLFQRLLLSQIAFEETWEKALRDKEERGVKDVAAVMDFFGQDSTIELLPPVDPVTGLAKTEGWKTEDLGQVQKVLEWCLDCNFTIEQSRDYLEEDSPDKGKVFSCWVLATADGFDEPIKGRVKVATQGGKVERFSFYPLRMKVMEKLRKKLEQICREA